MKIIFTLLAALISFTAAAQFTFLPEVGLETSKTKIKSNEIPAFAPLGIKISPSLSLRMAYTLKSGQGAFLGISTSSPSVQYTFADPKTAGTSYTANTDDIQLRLEAGYQYTSKPIRLSNHASSTKTGSSCQHPHRQAPRNCLTDASNRQYETQGNCSHHAPCGQHNSNGNFNRSMHRSKSEDKSWFMRVKPSVGLAFIPEGESEIEFENGSLQPKFEYHAGMKTAMIAGTAFEFGKGKEAKFCVSVNYIHSIGSNSELVNTVTNSKSTDYTFQSSTSGFNVKFGVPLSFHKAQKIAATPYPRCRRFVYHCGQYKITYRQ